RDDDFCSNCGAAVFSADDVSDSRSIDCNTYDRGHDHSKITYDVSERGTNVRPPVRQLPPSGSTPPAYNSNIFENRERYRQQIRNYLAPDNEQKKRVANTLTKVIIIFVLIVVAIQLIAVFSTISAFYGLFG
ncbi:MAG: hypothetical protein ILP19_04880, partial [Oscillospiraceae bacterium]|nr:hypothetical protein [Oscillospiraceae bacterium]